jgi:cell division protease FtsH
MDGFKDNEGIIVIGATNRQEILDQALLRPGRFDRKITVELPDKLGRKKILEVHSRNKNLDCSVDLNQVATATLGCSGAELENIMNEAAIMAARDQRKTITMEDINESLDKVILGLKTNKKISNKTKKTIAYHEAGHALIAAIVDGPETVRKISIIPRGKTGGVTMFMPPVETEEINLQTKQYLKNRIMVGLGGTVAEEIVFGEDNITTGASGDIEQITQIANAMVKDFGFSVEKGKVKISGNTDEEVKTIIDDAYKNTKSFMITYRDKLDEIATKLLVNEIIETKEFMEIFKRAS